MRGGPWRLGATHAATASQSRISVWKGGAPIGSGASACSAAWASASGARLKTRIPSTWASQNFASSVLVPRTCSSRGSPKQSSGRRRARATSAPATSSSSTEGSPNWRAAQCPSRLNAALWTSPGVAAAPGACAISHSMRTLFSLLRLSSRRSGTR